MARYFAFLLLTPILFGQSADTVLTQTLISEIRALRQDLETTNATSQRVQIALYRLQSQTAIVSSAQQRLDAAHTRVGEIQNQRRSFANQAQMIEELSRTDTDPNKRKEHLENLASVKTLLETATAEETARRSTEADAEAQLRLEQSRLNDLQSLLDRLDKALDELVRGKK